STQETNRMGIYGERVGGFARQPVAAKRSRRLFSRRRRPVVSSVASETSRFPRSSARRKTVRGWPCEVDVSPPRGRDGESQSRRRKKALQSRVSGALEREPTVSGTTERWVMAVVMIQPMIGARFAPPIEYRLVLDQFHIDRTRSTFDDTNVL